MLVDTINVELILIQGPGSLWAMFSIVHWTGGPSLDVELVDHMEIVGLFVQKIKKLVDIIHESSPVNHFAQN